MKDIWGCRWTVSYFKERRERQMSERERERGSEREGDREQKNRIKAKQLHVVSLKICPWSSSCVNVNEATRKYTCTDTHTHTHRHTHAQTHTHTRTQGNMFASHPALELRERNGETAGMTSNPSLVGRMARPCRHEGQGCRLKSWHKQGQRLSGWTDSTDHRDGE